MAGDRGMRFPELTGASLQHLNLPKECKGEGKGGGGGRGRKKGQGGEKPEEAGWSGRHLFPITNLVILPSPAIPPFVKLALPRPPSDGYSTSRTCEMSLSNHSGINFRGLVYLIDEATKAKAPAAASR